MKPRVCILRTDGTNCDQEAAYAFEKCGAVTELVHVNQLRDRDVKLQDFQIMVIPGGFSYGDDVHSGKVLAVELISLFREELSDFVSRNKLVLGICNGFQVLVRTGLLPDADPGKIKVTLMDNDSGRFECRWVNMRVQKSPCVFTEGMEGATVSYQAAHGEGKFFAEPDVLKDLEARGLVVLRYVDRFGSETMSYPQNPNGSLNAIAGLCDPSGRIFGLMPHPERYVDHTQHPLWRRKNGADPDGLFVFKNAVRYAANI
ncbi:MAG: phosphoribosylformylglycinamidine synthase I [Desulforudis sp.]|jgi:phosphoribosylformylglycinamidine synthase|nr:phosphoribosylformylglycinamidine synthase I [Clostridia bacterium]MDQ7791773.1 phosphoribosylformylglycinamidine synthase I [Clostridia bacterium]RJX22931.1 MAG: phosphoribosylformylglycinamidine synthase I [Desulforudis sp.]